MAPVEAAMNDSARDSRHALGDYAYDALYVGGIGGGLVALFFLAYDVIAHRGALFTPSLMGSVLFDGADPGQVQSVDMMAVAKYTAFHFFAFGVLGLFISFLAHQADMRARHPAAAMGVLFVILEAGFWIGSQVAIPGTLSRIGVGPATIANLLGAAGIAAFLTATHRPELWARMRRALHLGGAGGNVTAGREAR
jgi:hypothetical protein